MRLTPSEKLAERLTDLLEGIAKPVQADRISFPSGGGRVESHRAGCARWEVPLEMLGAGLYGRVYSWDSVTDCARYAHLELEGSGCNEWEAHALTRAAFANRAELRAKREAEATS